MKLHMKIQSFRLATHARYVGTSLTCSSTIHRLSEEQRLEARDSPYVADKNSAPPCMTRGGGAGGI